MTAMPKRVGMTVMTVVKVMKVKTVNPAIRAIAPATPVPRVLRDPGMNGKSARNRVSSANSRINSLIGIMTLIRSSRSLMLAGRSIVRLPTSRKL